MTRSWYVFQSPQFKYPTETNQKKSFREQMQKASLVASTDTTASKSPTQLTFSDFVDSIPDVIRMRQDILGQNSKAFDGETEDPVMALLR